MDDLHPTTGTPTDWLRTATLGFVGGLRTVMPWALVSAYLARQGPDIADGGWVVDVFATRRCAVVLGLAALVELALDKTTLVPSRVQPLALAARIISAGLACTLASLAEGRTSDSGALLGSVGGAFGSAVGYAFRTRLPLPGLVLALAEDAVAFLLGRWAVEH
jgi:uncharacterized membrane protein